MYQAEMCDLFEVKTTNLYTFVLNIVYSVTPSWMIICSIHNLPNIQIYLGHYLSRSPKISHSQLFRTRCHTAL